MPRREARLRAVCTPRPLPPHAGDDGRAHVAFFRGRVDTGSVSHAALMRARIDTPRGRTQYGQRFATVEPVSGNLRYNKGLDRFTLRGRTKEKWESV